MPVFWHVLVLKAGRVLAAGTKRAVMSTALRHAFDALCDWSVIGRYTLIVEPKKPVVI